MSIKHCSLFFTDYVDPNRRVNGTVSMWLGAWLLSKGFDSVYGWARGLIRAGRYDFEKKGGLGLSIFCDFLSVRIFKQGDG